MLLGSACQTGITYRFYAFFVSLCILPPACNDSQLCTVVLCAQLAHLTCEPRVVLFLLRSMRTPCSMRTPRSMRTPCVRHPFDLGVALLL